MIFDTTTFKHPKLGLICFGRTQKNNLFNMEIVGYRYNEGLKQFNKRDLEYFNTIIEWVYKYRINKVRKNVIVINEIIEIEELNWQYLQTIEMIKLHNEKLHNQKQQIKNLLYQNKFIKIKFQASK